jgi:VWFA-related protein
VDVVQVDVSVLDKDRHPVPGLTAADFTIREDGKARPVIAFSTVTLPQPPPEPAAAWVREVGPDVTANTTPQSGRLVVIVFDHSIATSDMPEARRTAEAAVDQLRPGDMAAVVYTSVGVPQNFTADRSLLRAAIQRPFLGIQTDSGDPDGARRGECRCGVCSLELMTNVADAVRDVPHRRKMLLFIGSDVSVVKTSVECVGEVTEARKKLLRAAGAANLAIHTFDSNLLRASGASASQSGEQSPGNGLANLERQGNLSVYPAETGGRAIKNTNAPWGPMSAVFAESNAYYVLAFAPASRRSDGSYHEISVDVNRGGVQVYPRKGYYAPSRAPASTAKPSDGAPPASLTAAVSNLWPETAMPLSVAAAAFATSGKPGAAVVLVLRAHEPLAVEQASGAPVIQGRSAQAAQVNVLAGAYGHEGEALDRQVQSLVVVPRPDAQEVFEYEVISRLRLKPGRHEIRVAAEDTARGLSGSVYTYVDVPDFAKAPVSLSGVVLGTSPATSRSPVHDLFPVTPTARRQFAPTESVTAFVRVYQPAKARPVPVTITTRILDASNHTAHETRTPLFADGASTSADYRFDLPLASLGKGDYVLTIEAARGVKQTARRDVLFTVR